MSSFLLEVRDARRRYWVKSGLFTKRPLDAVDGVDLTIEEGEVIGIVGESGCGKSTLSRLMLGMEKPTSGSILINGKPISMLSRIDVAKQVQPIFQDPYSSLNPRKTVGAIVELPLRVHKISDPQKWRKRVDEVLTLVGLPKHLYNSYPNQLSGGQRQRVAIARALVVHPKVVLCDEPTSALDVSVQAQILNELLKLQRELNLTYVLISHNLAVIEHMATKVAVMYLGRVVELANAEAVFRSPKHPYTRALLNSVLTPDPELNVPDTDIGGAFPNPLFPPTGCAFHPRCPMAENRCREISPRLQQVDTNMVACHLYDRQKT